MKMWVIIFKNMFHVQRFFVVLVSMYSHRAELTEGTERYLTAIIFSQRRLRQIFCAKDAGKEYFYYNVSQNICITSVEICFQE